MPRDAFSNYVLPAGNPVVTGTIIASSWANSTLNDIATALTQSLSTDGSTATVNLINKTMNNGSYGNITITGSSTWNTTGTIFTTNSITAASLNTPGVTTTSTITLTGGKIAFPSVQLPSADPNTLDDYEEGTWTPTIALAVPGTSTIVYALQNGQYTKIGNLVSINFELITSTFNTGTGTGSLRLSTLPFVSASANIVATGIIGGHNNDTITPNTTNVLAWFATFGATFFELFNVNNTNGNLTLITTATGGMAAAQNKNYRCTATYKV